jgi:hypothetical protein
MTAAIPAGCARATWGIVVVVALAVATPAAAQTPTNTWTNVASTFVENWSVDSNWSGGVPPSAPTTILQFNAVATASYTATNNLGIAFDLNGFLLNNNAGATVSIASTTGPLSSIRLTGANPFVNQVGPGSVNFTNTAGLILAPSSGTTTVGGAGPGNLTFAGVIQGTGGLTVNQTGTGVVSFAPLSANTFTGNLTLQAGHLSISATPSGPTPWSSTAGRSAAPGRSRRASSSTPTWSTPAPALAPRSSARPPRRTSSAAPVGSASSRWRASISSRRTPSPGRRPSPRPASSAPASAPSATWHRPPSSNSAGPTGRSSTARA